MYQRWKCREFRQKKGFEKSHRCTGRRPRFLRRYFFFFFTRKLQVFRYSRRPIRSRLRTVKNAHGLRPRTPLGRFTRTGNWTFAWFAATGESESCKQRAASFPSTVGTERVQSVTGAGGPSGRRRTDEHRSVVTLFGTLQFPLFMAPPRNVFS